MKSRKPKSTTKAAKSAVKKLPAKKSSAKKSTAQKHLHYHKDGSLWAKGELTAGIMTGYWEWFRKDGTRLRSGHFDNGQQIGEWSTYDRHGKVYKVTQMKPKLAKAGRKRVAP